MRWLEVLRAGVLQGALAGLVGGAVLGATTDELGRLPEIAQIVRSDSAVVGLVVLLVVSALVGGGFGVLVWYQRPGAGETLVWGLVYGVLWWHLGPLTLTLLLEGDGLTWDVKSAQAEFPLLLGHVLYGATIGLALVLVQWRRYLAEETMHVSGGAIVRVGVAGLLGAGLLGVMLDVQDQLLAFAAMVDSDSHSTAWLITLLIGLVAGLAFSLLYPSPTDGAGAGLIRGMAYGLFWWVVGGLTTSPAVQWSRATLAVGRCSPQLCHFTRLPFLRCRRVPVLPVAGRPGTPAIFRFRGRR